MKGLIIKPKWAELILNGEKTLEIRGSRTNTRGRIGIIKSGSKKVYGTAELNDCIKLTEDNYDTLRDFHKLDISYEELLEIYKNPQAWVLSKAEKYEVPVDYEHKRGCIIWVNI